MEPSLNRRSIRLVGYDYAAEGSYFITICVEQKEHRFGCIRDDVMVLNEAGRMIEERLLIIPEKFPSALIDAYVRMPNHIHMIVSLVGAAHRGRPFSDATATAHKVPATADWLSFSIFNVPGDNVELDGGPRMGGHDGPPLQDIVRWFKTITTNYYIKGVKAGTYPPFNRRLWQRNYYEHIIRTDKAYQQINEYIETNPQRWHEDRLR